VEGRGENAPAADENVLLQCPSQTVKAAETGCARTFTSRFRSAGYFVVPSSDLSPSRFRRGTINNVKYPGYKMVSRFQ